LPPIEAVQTRIKICCIGSVDEAALAGRCGADALGLVSAIAQRTGGRRKLRCHTARVETTAIN